jgi:heat shock protein HslJ
MSRRPAVVVSCVVSCVVGCVASLILASCGSDHRAAAQLSPDGHAYDAIGATGFVLPAGAAVRVVFDGFSVHVTGVCSTMTGDYKIVEGLLVVPSLTRADATCTSPTSLQLDDHLAALVRSSPRLRLASGVLTLSSGATALQLRETTSAADLPLEGTLWTVTGVGNGDTVSRDNSVQPATLRFHDGLLDLFAGCNVGTAKAFVRAHDVQITDLVLGKRGCPSTQMQLEFNVVLALSGNATVRIEGESLVIATGSHSLLLEGASG